MKLTLVFLATMMAVATIAEEATYGGCKFCLEDWCSEFYPDLVKACGIASGTTIDDACRRTIERFGCDCDVECPIGLKAPEMYE